MSALIRLRGLIVVALMLAAGFSNHTNAADSIELTGDGWHRWQVPSIEHPEDETIYVLIKSGKATEIEIRGHWCNGHSHKNAIDHGVLSVDESIDWLQQYLGTRSDLSSDALAAISRHAGVECPLSRVHSKNYIAAIAAITTVRTAKLNVAFPAETHTSGSTFTRSDGNDCFIYKFHAT